MPGVLAGDMVHVVPCTFKQGICFGIQDSLSPELIFLLKHGCPVVGSCFGRDDTLLFGPVRSCFWINFCKGYQGIGRGNKGGKQSKGVSFPDPPRINSGGWKQ